MEKKVVKITVSQRPDGIWEGTVEDGTKVTFPETVRTKADVFTCLGHPQGSGWYYQIEYK